MALVRCHNYRPPSPPFCDCQSSAQRNSRGGGCAVRGCTERQGRTAPTISPTHATAFGAAAEMLSEQLRRLARPFTVNHFQRWNLLGVADIWLVTVEKSRNFVYISPSERKFSENELDALFRAMRSRLLRDGFVVSWKNIRGAGSLLTSRRHIVSRLNDLPDDITDIFRELGQSSGRTLQKHVRGGVSSLLLKSDKRRVYSLPDELLRAIFQLLELREQVSCRLVCKTWSWLIKQMMGSHIELNLSKRAYHNDALLMALEQVISRRTKVILFTFLGFPSDPFGILFSILKFKRIRIPVIVLSNLDVWANDILVFSDSWTLRFRSEWAEVCDKLVLHKTTVRGLPYIDVGTCRCCLNGLESDTNDYLYYIGWPFCFWVDLYKHVNIEKSVIATQNVVPMESALGLLEKCCPSLCWEQPWKYSDTSACLMALKNVLSDPTPSQNIITSQVLKLWQRGDPRFKDTATLMDNPLKGIPLESLRNVTLFILYWHFIQDDQY
ncbi:uncharacterized protein LOC129596415 [Paramacrobiotus metropolitanus]|uniref:uncharacterized protein LOC129596415 n=1 Tax=Paramacrobiotus metropolitanus TaxID=2943436 RepID=UPI0024456778|nr:uncharacterized protein LOC129596415 [Paramacrobiotus metropolitanus]